MGLIEHDDQLALAGLKKRRQSVVPSLVRGDHRLKSRNDHVIRRRNGTHGEVTGRRRNDANVKLGAGFRDLGNLRGGV
jgi:hypothetical protein